MSVIAGFFETFHLHEVRHLSFSSLQIAVTTDNTLFEKAEDRNGLFAFHEYLEELVEAAPPH